MTNDKITFLLIEDDPVDAELFSRVVRKRGLSYPVQLAAHGGEALEILRANMLAETENEMILFLDLNMPGLNGHEFLTALRADSKLCRAIVFVLTSSDHERDIRLAYDKNVAGYFNKQNIEGLMETITHYVKNVLFPLQRPGNPLTGCGGA